MKRIYIIILAALSLVTACEEFQPVVTGKYPAPQEAYLYSDDEIKEMFGVEEFTSIADVKEMYTDNNSKPYDILKPCVIKGQVITSDKSGNVYKSFYIQDDTAGIEIKVGKTGLYNDYKMGQWIYVSCESLTVGSYNGMVQIGYKDETEEYETAYLEHSALIDQHIFKGALVSKEEYVKPVVLSENVLSSESAREPYLGRLVTIEGAKYWGKVFCIAYINPNIVDEDKKKSNENRFFLDKDDPTNWNINSWAMSEQCFKKHVEDGDFDDVKMNDGVMLSERKANIIPTPYTMNQYFIVGNTLLQVRSSGYAKFADTDLPGPVLDGSETVTFTGVLTLFINSDGPQLQFTLIDLDGVKKSDGTPWYN